MPAFALPFRLLDDIQAPKEYEETKDYTAFRSALSEIAGDLFLLTSLRSGLNKIPSSEWSRANSSLHFISSDWIERYARGGLDLLDQYAISEEIESQRKQFATTVNPFNDRTASYSDLCKLATTFGLREQAKHLLRRSIACVVSYGWHKDPTIHFVINAITAISSHDRPFATEMLRRVTPIVARIGDMTEDTGARPSDLTGLILALTPDAFAAFYNHWLVTSNWYTADLVFARLLETESLDVPAISLVTCAVWDSHAIESLRKRAHAGDVKAATIIAANAARFGFRTEDFGKARQTHSSSVEKDPNIDVSEYPPKDARRLLEDLRTQRVFVAERRIVREWFQYWLVQGRGVDLLRELESFLSEDRIPSGLEEILDLAFDASVQLEGKQRAYRWLVAAQVHRRGWDEYHEQADALRRFSTFASHYKDRWRQFIAETTKPLDGSTRRSLTIPHHRLVHFFLEVDEIRAAKSVVEVMVDTICEEFAEQPLEHPPWVGVAIS